MRELLDARNPFVSPLLSCLPSASDFCCSLCLSAFLLSVAVSLVCGLGSRAKARNFLSPGTGGRSAGPLHVQIMSKNVQKSPQNAPKNLPKSTPKSTQKAPRTPPKTRSPKSRENDSRMFPKRRPKGAPRDPKNRQFRLIFLTIFEKASGTLPERLPRGLGPIWARFWVHFWLHFGSKIEAG